MTTSCSRRSPIAARSCSTWPRGLLPRCTPGAAGWRGYLPAKPRSSRERGSHASDSDSVAHGARRGLGGQRSRCRRACLVHSRPTSPVPAHGNAPRDGRRLDVLTRPTTHRTCRGPRRFDATNTTSGHLLAWAPVANASAYTIEILRGGQLIYSSTTRRANVGIPGRWRRRDGHTITLSPGTYRWYALAGVRQRRDPTSRPEGGNRIRACDRSVNPVVRGAPNQPRCPAVSLARSRDSRLREKTQCNLRNRRALPVRGRPACSPGRPHRHRRGLAVLGERYVSGQDGCYANGWG